MVTKSPILTGLQLNYYVAHFQTAWPVFALFSADDVIHSNGCCKHKRVKMVVDSICPVDEPFDAKS